MTKNFIDIKNFTKKDLDKILSIAKKIKKNPEKFTSACKNKTLGLIFEKQSLRTRLSFNVGMKKLGGNVIELNSREIGFSNRREDPKDILNVLAQFIDCLMIRNNNHKQIIDLSNQKTLPIINGLTEQSHPCQILGDFLTIQEIFKNKKNILLTWIGDFNNVLVSLLELQNIYLFNLNIVLPSKIFKLKEKQIRIYKNNKTKFFNNPLEGVRNSNCIMTDVWISMGDKQKNKIKYFRNFTVNKKIMNNSAKNAIFMHCLPAKRGQEVSSDVLDSKKSVILQQAKNRMYIQQAILIYVLKK